ncbi:NFATC2-interacting protein isoform X2 [Clupea harengus]|uniref:NFATC2-interacting protein n=1 Tax=Clupea harengus TaxID=7950 RepID=A0A6P8ELH2_CLUHA|nr:NFATC2-interacting protein isoform X2 [Clupea harengus]
MSRNVLGRKRTETAAGEGISDSDSDGPERRVPAKPRPKRRRILDSSAMTTVQIYSKKVDSDLKLRPLSFRTETLQDGDVEDTSPQLPVVECIELSDSEDEKQDRKTQTQPVTQPDPQPEPHGSIQSPSPPPPPCKGGRRPNRKLMEINRKLDAIGSLLSPSPERRGLVPNHSQSVAAEEEHDDDDEEDDDDDDLVIVDPQRQRVRPPAPSEPRPAARHVPLKFRCRTEILRIPLLTTAPLKLAVEELSIKLKVPPSRLLLLRKEAELPVTSTISELGLGIADIIDCVVISEDSHEHDDGNHGEGDVITVRLQGKEKGSQQEYSVHKREPLGSVLTSYTSALTPALRRKARFLFDGSKVNPTHTPLDLDMEDGDVVEVWF